MTRKITLIAAAAAIAITGLSFSPTDAEARTVLREGVSGMANLIAEGGDFGAAGKARLVIFVVRRVRGQSSQRRHGKPMKLERSNRCGCQQRQRDRQQRGQGIAVGEPEHERTGATGDQRGHQYPDCQ